MGVECLPKMRTIMHPGPARQPRARALDVIVAPAISLIVPPGRDLFETVHDRLRDMGAGGAAFTLWGGSAARVRLMTGGPGRDGLPMGFHGPHALAGPLEVVAGAAGCGFNEAGARFTHCHAAFRDRSGRLVGGHLIPGETIAGPAGIAVALSVIAQGLFRRRFDRETRFSLFHPDPA